MWRAFAPPAFTIDPVVISEAEEAEIFLIPSLVVKKKFPFASIYFIRSPVSSSS